MYVYVYVYPSGAILKGLSSFEYHKGSTFKEPRAGSRKVFRHKEREERWRFWSSALSFL